MPILEALKHPYVGVRAAAAQALGELKDERAIEPLIETLKLDKVLEVKINAVQTLVKLESKESITAIKEVLANKEFWSNRTNGFWHVRRRDLGKFTKVANTAILSLETVE